MSNEDEFLKEIRNSLAEQVKKEMEEKQKGNGNNMSDKNKARKKKKKLNIFLKILIVLLVVILAGGSFLVFTKPGRKIMTRIAVEWAFDRMKKTPEKPAKNATGSAVAVEEKEEEAWTSFWKARNFRQLPETSDPRNLRPFCTEAVQECANSLDSPGPARTFARNLWRPDLPAVLGTSGPACTQRLGPWPCTLSPLTYPLVATTIYTHPLLHSRVSKVIAHLYVSFAPTYLYS